MIAKVPRYVCFLETRSHRHGANEFLGKVLVLASGYLPSEIPHDEPLIFPICFQPCMEVVFLKPSFNISSLF